MNPTLPGTRRFQALWTEPALRRRAVRFFADGLLRGDGRLAGELIGRLDALLRPRLPAADSEVHCALRSLVARNRAAYDAAFAADDRERVGRRVEQVARLVTARPRAVLDIGAGDGAIAARLKEHWDGVPVYALDPARGGRTPAVAWLTCRPDGSIPLPDACVDLVTCLMVLHHVPRPQALLGEARRVLRPGGTLLVRETDAALPEDALFSAVMDELFYAVLRAVPGVPPPAAYRCARDWGSLFERLGFITSPAVGREPGNPFNPVYFVLGRLERR